MSTVILRSATQSEARAVRDLVFEILSEFGFTPDPAGTDADLEDLELSYLSRGGAFDLAVDQQGTLLGCVGLYPVDRTTVELRKMYLRQQSRGLGLGRRLLDHALSRAQQLGFSVVVLQTSSVLEKAITLYLGAGFEPYHPLERVPRCDLALRLVLGRRPSGA